MAEAPDSFVITSPQNEAESIGDTLITPTGGAQGRLADQLGGSAPPGTSALIASAIGVDLNTAGDTTMTLSAFATGKFFVVDYSLWTNPSDALTTVEWAIGSGAGATGQSYAVQDGPPEGLTDPRDWQVVFGNQVAVNAGPGTMQNTAPVLAVTVEEGSAATADFYIYGRIFT